MKTEKLIEILLTVSGIGLVAFIIYEVAMKPKAAPGPATATTGTAGPFDAIYKGLGSLFGANKTTDNTGQLISASGQAATGLISSIKSLFPTGGTPVASPVQDLAPVTTAGFDPNNTN